MFAISQKLENFEPLKYLKWHYNQIRHHQALAKPGFNLTGFQY